MLKILLNFILEGITPSDYKIIENSKIFVFWAFNKIHVYRNLSPDRLPDHRGIPQDFSNGKSDGFILGIPAGHPRKPDLI